MYLDSKIDSQIPLRPYSQDSTEYVCYVIVAIISAAYFDDNNVYCISNLIMQIIHGAKRSTLFHYIKLLISFNTSLSRRHNLGVF